MSETKNKLEEIDSPEKLPKTSKNLAEDLNLGQLKRGSEVENWVLTRPVATQKQFEEINFKYTTFDFGYFRNCKFLKCDFTGCTFLNTNFTKSDFIYCNFDYCIFSNTRVTSSILEQSPPEKPNLRRLFARTLRVNFQQVGDLESAKKATNLELAATREYLHKACFSKETYYRKKYPDFARFGKLFQFLRFQFENYLWGNGESLLKLSRSILIFIFLVFLLNLYNSGENVLFWQAHCKSINDTFLACFGINFSASFTAPQKVAISFVRHILFGLFVALVIKKYSRIK